jgi:AbrB family looped-hinge helix DNA binding protein
MGMNIARGKVIAGGRIALPAEMRRALGLQNGDTVLFELQGDEIRIRPARSALKRVQERLKAFAPKEGFVSEELIAQRRVEAARDR